MTARSVAAWLTRRSVRRQLIACVAGVQMILAIAFVYELVDRQKVFLMRRTEDRVLHQASVLAASFVPQLITNDYAGMKEVLISMASGNSMLAALVTDERGKIIAASDRGLDGKYLTDGASLRVMKGEPKATITARTDMVLYAAAPIVSDGHLFGWAWVTGDTGADRQQLEALRREGFLYVVIAIGAGIMFAILVANTITRQLRLILAGTERLANNVLDQAVPVTSDTEAGAVARAFNDAMKTLAAEREQVAKAHARLEAEVAERRRAERELQSANRAILAANDRLRAFAYAASHDLQEPLRAVTGYSELLRKRYAGKLDEDGNDFIQFMHDGAARMQKLIQALLEYSRAGGRGDSPPELVDTRRALHTALQNLEFAIESAHAEIVCADLPAVRAHQIAVVQLFQNLIGNAIKYAGGERPQVQIWAEMRDEWCRIGVRDNGIGIDPQDHERIFGIFKRVHGSQYPGAGVGLAICSKLVERYGGTIWVDSTPGKGSTFWFTLPAALEGTGAPANVTGVLTRGK